MKQNTMNIFFFLGYLLYQLTLVLVNQCDFIHDYFKCLCLIFIVIITFKVLKTKGFLKEVGLRKISKESVRKCMYFIPMFALPLCNMINNHSLVFYEFFIVAFSSFYEELFFRGYLPVALNKLSLFKNIMLSSVLFSLAHITNLFGLYDPLYVVWQLIFALVVGISFMVIRHISKSILPCIIIHFFINITANASLPDHYFVYYSVCMLIYLTYSMYLYKNNMKKED